MRQSHLLGLCLGLFLAAAPGLGCRRAAPTPEGPAAPGEPPWFEDVTDKVGLDFVHDAGPFDDRYPMPQLLGSGAAIFDFDGDGLLDVFLLQNGGPRGARNRLFKQLPGGRFRDVSATSNLAFAGYNMGVAVGDVNNDGRPDVLVTRYRGVKLFLNNGDGSFTDATRAAGLDDPLWATSACFFDYDRDGWLDLVVVNYVDYDPSWPCTSPRGTRDYCAPKVFSGTVTKLFHNRGRKGTGASGSPAVAFEDVTVASGLGDRPGPGLGVVCADFNGDDWPDVFVANDGQPNHLWINRHNGTFTEQAAARGVAVNQMGTAEANMGIALGDVNGDGLMDLFVTHLTAETNTLWQQGPRGVFRDRTVFARLARPAWRGTGFGTVMEDFDQDGALDVAVVNGRVSKDTEPHGADLGPHWGLYAERNQLFANDGTGRFRDISPHNPAFSGAYQIGRGLLAADVDGDGAVDLLVTAVGGRARLFRNVAPGRGHRLVIRVVDPDLHRDALGAEVTVHAGKRRWVRLIHSGGSFLCAGDPRAHFGLGDTGRVDHIDVVWPDGKRERFEGVAADGRPVVLTRGTGSSLPNRRKTSSGPMP